MSSNSFTEPRKLPWDALPEPTYRYYYEVFEKVFLNEFALLVEKTRRSVIEFVTIVRGKINLHMTGADGYRLVWEELSDQDDLQDFIFKITICFRFYLGKIAWTNLMDNIAASIGVLSSPVAETSEYSIADPAFASTVQSPKTTWSILEGSQWIVTIFMIYIMEPSMVGKLGAVLGASDEASSDNDNRSARVRHNVSPENNG